MTGDSGSGDKRKPGGGSGKGKDPRKDPDKETSAGDQNKFSSFKDLLRSRGGEPESEAANEPGWSLERAGASSGGAAADEGHDETPRSRITSRPAAFGPMEHGPEVYRDIESEEMTLLGSFRVRTVFPDDVLAEVASLPDDPHETDFAGRVDLRGGVNFTIDGDDAQDFDDAIGIAQLPNGNLEIGVHIADVSHYVRPGTALDDEALARATSVYLADQVVPMLPEKLSNSLCSLVAKRDRLAHSVIMEFTPDGKRVSARVHKSVICSAHRNTYRIVQELLDGKETEETAAILFLEQPLRMFRAWTLVQQKIRDARGSLRMQSSERKFVFDKDHEVEKIVDAPRYFSQTLIEETALAANQAVGDLFRKRGLPTIYRVHPEKDPEEIEALAKSLADHGIRIPTKDRLTGRDIAQLILAARRKSNAEALIQRIMGLIERAVYEVKDHEDVAKHFGLAREAYLHFTSPIRRYPDLVVHRWLHAIESLGKAAEDELRTADLIQDLNEMAAHSSLQADVAEMAEQAIGDLKVCQYMSAYVGETHLAQIRRVSNFGIEVHLSQFNVNGFLPARSIGEKAKVKGPTLQLLAGKRMLSFTEGTAIKILIKEVDFLKLQVLLALG